MTAYQWKSTPMLPQHLAERLVDTDYPHFITHSCQSWRIDLKSWPMFQKAQVNPSQLCCVWSIPSVWCLMSLTKIRILRSPKCLRCDTQMTLHPSWRDESAPPLSLKICLANPLCGSFRVKKYIDCRRFRVSLGFGQSRPHGGILLSCWIESFHTLPHFYHVQWSWC